MSRIIASRIWRYPLIRSNTNTAINEGFLESINGALMIADSNRVYFDRILSC